MSTKTPPLSKTELEKKYKFPKLEFSFHLDPVKGDKTELSFHGDFTVKVLTLDEEANYLAERDRWITRLSQESPEEKTDNQSINAEQLLDGSPVGFSVRSYIDMRCYLKQAVLEAPEWWWDFQKFDLDMNVLTMVFFHAKKLKEKLDKVLLQDKKEAIIDGPPISTGPGKPEPGV